MTGLLLLCLLAALPTGNAAPAQDFGARPARGGRSDLPDHALLLRQEVNRTAVITLRDGQSLRGEIMEVDGSEITLALEAGTLMEARAGISWAQVREVRVERRLRILEGVLIGGAGGALLSAISPDDGLRKEVMGIEGPERMWESAFQGAIVGAVAGIIRGMDVVLAPTSRTYPATGLYRPDTAGIRPTLRVINTVPSASLTRLEIEESMQAGLGSGHEPNLGDAWNGQAGATLALETSVPAIGRWWLRNRTEWTSLGRIGYRGGASFGGDEGPLEYWRDYDAVRTFFGPVYPIGATGRLPTAEIAVMAGVARTTLRSSAAWEGTFSLGGSDAWESSSKQKVVRPLLMASGSLTVVRQPKLSVAVRAEGVMGPGFNADALINDGEILFPKHRITPIGFSIGVEVFFPNF